MEKLVINEKLLSRIKYASMNGSVVATCLLDTIKRNSNKNIHESVGNKTANYFDSVLTKSTELSEVISYAIGITYCSKDVNNPNFPDKGNPQAPYFKENRTRISPVEFAKLFKDVEDQNFSDEDYQYFHFALLLCSRVRLILSNKMQDIEYAYSDVNYVSKIEKTYTTLHNSCMRRTDRDIPRNVADFYANVTGSYILMALDEENNVLARAIVWKDVLIDGYLDNSSFIDRVYFSYYFLSKMMINYASANNIDFCKMRNDYNSCKSFRSLRDRTLVKEDGMIREVKKGESYDFVCKKFIPQYKWHKKGAPYCDTMCCVYYDENWRNLVITNTLTSYKCLVECRSTNGYGVRGDYSMCPKCGKVHSDGERLCSECKDEMIVKTPLGNVLKGIVRKYKDNYYPSELLTKSGLPKEPLAVWLAIQKMIG